MGQIDKHLDFIPYSGRHSCVSWEDDMKQLAEQLNRPDILNLEPSWYHSHFPGFPRNYPLLLEVLEFKRWVYKKLKEFRSMKYLLDNITIQDH